MECFRLLFDHLAWIKHQFLSCIRDSRMAGSLWGSLWGMMRGVRVVRVDWPKVRLGLLCWGFKGIQEEIPLEQASAHKIGWVAFPPGQCTSPQLYPCHRLFDQDDWPIFMISGSNEQLHQAIGIHPTKAWLSQPVNFKNAIWHFRRTICNKIKTVPYPPYSPRPCPLWFLVIPEAQRLSLWENWGDERGCDEGHWHAETRGLLCGLPEVVGTVQQVHCSWRRLLWRGLEFHVCTINKSGHTKKVWKLIVCTSYFK